MAVVNTRYGKMQTIASDKIVSQSLVRYGEWANEELELLSKLISPGMTVLDIGAFIGSHSLALSKFVGATGKVYSFEPRKEIFEILCENIKLNDCENLKAINKGLGDRNTSIELSPLSLERNANFGGLALTDGIAKNIGNYRIDVVSIDSLNFDKKIDLVKVDVEGMEREVLDGGIDTIGKNRPIIFCECNSLNSGADILRFCAEIDYTIFGILTSAFNSRNFNNDQSNIFGTAKEFSLLLVPSEQVMSVKSKAVEFEFLEIGDVEDLVLPLLHKPQYLQEVLLHTSTGNALGIKFATTETMRKDDIIERKDDIIERKDDIIGELSEDIKNLKLKMDDITSYYERTVGEFTSSLSWRITKPIRLVGNLARKIHQIAMLLKKYSHVYRTPASCFQLLYKSFIIVKSDGISGIKNRISYYETGGMSAALLATSHSSISSDLVLDENCSSETIFLPEVAVHVHLFYMELLGEIIGSLSAFPGKFSLYVSTDTAQKADIISTELVSLKNVGKVNVIVVENRGRDIFPLLCVFGPELLKYDLVLHIHTKRSPHNILALAGWRRYLMDSLIGNEKRIRSIYHKFEIEPNLGLFFPEHYFPVKKFANNKDYSNDTWIKKLFVRIGEKPSETSSLDKTFFPSGSMFWIRGKALSSLVELDLCATDFEAEQGQVNGTLAHSIERIIPYFLRRAGFEAKTYRANPFLSGDGSSSQFAALRNLIKTGQIRNPTIVFDHNGGGGTNVFTTSLVKSLRSEGSDSIRIYFNNDKWIAQWIGEYDGMLFHTISRDDIFEMILESKSAKVIVNSLYGCPDIPDIIAQILKIVKNLNAHLDVMMHDFFALCPSPHLSDYNNKYCGVPENPMDCVKCLIKNQGWFHAWYPNSIRPVEITSWRKPFEELFDRASKIIFFDYSSVEIVKKWFILDSAKIEIVPHKMDHFDPGKPADLSGPVRIGILGTLSHIKGGDIVTELSDYIEKAKLSIPITIVGPSVVGTPKKVLVHGPYGQVELPKLIEKYGINVILMPSIVPETFSYTISEAVKMGLPVVAFDLGAQGNRVKNYQFGKVIPIGSSPEEILNAVQTVLTSTRERVKRC